MQLPHQPKQFSSPARGLSHNRTFVPLGAHSSSRASRSRWATEVKSLDRCLDPHDYFLHDPHAVDPDDYDQCVLGAEAEQCNHLEKGGITWDDFESSCRVLIVEGSRAGGKLARYTGNRVESGVRVTMDHLPYVRKKSASAIKSMAQKVVGEENVTKLKRSVDDLPEGWIARIIWFWEQPFVKLGRLTMFFARLPAVWALALTQFGLVAGQLSLPMLPPLLLGAGMLTRTIWVNANFIFPRIYVIAILLYITWFANSVVQKTVVHFKHQGSVDDGFATTIINWTECTAILVAAVIILSTLGVKVSGLFLPAGICLALASKDVSYNFVAGIFLFLVQPFGTGDEVSVQSSVPGGDGGKWLEGTCERIDLRYTILRKGSYQLFIPNKSFMTREFLVKSESTANMQDKSNHHFWDNMPGTNIGTGHRAPVSSASNPTGKYPVASEFNQRHPESVFGNSMESPAHRSTKMPWSDAPYVENGNILEESPASLPAKAFEHSPGEEIDCKGVPRNQNRDPPLP